MKAKKQKKGFTIVEAVIAMALTTLITVATLSLCANAIQSSAIASRTFVAENYCADVLNCYKASVLHGQDFGETLVAYDSGIVRVNGDVESYTSVSQGVTYSISLSESALLDVTATLGSREICSVRYKGGDYA